MDEGDKCCEGRERNEKLITSSIKIEMIHHDVWTGCGRRLIKDRTSNYGVFKFRMLYNKPTILLRKLQPVSPFIFKSF
ncbi:hypothetical protein L798_02218 [Zootermopsis nevadensis]|uniref:Uncharacterized protein n=1 Tax=Zootermopsis nevadensis TaxID=136037 RepID=A0A067QS31_ZOONE|nr:hypothetical protein L798_02218 [Zootermopsis nevadensis]